MLFVKVEFNEEKFFEEKKIEKTRFIIQYLNISLCLDFVVFICFKQYQRRRKK